MPETVDGEDDLVIESEVITIVLTGFQDLPDHRIRLGPNVVDNFPSKEFGSQPSKVRIAANRVSALSIPFDARPKAIPQGLANKSMSPGVVHLLMASFDRPFSFT